MIAQLFAAIALAVVTPDEPAAIAGYWTNPKETVAIRLAPCGHALCGRVIWASPSAMDDARRGGTADLVGTEIMRDMVAGQPGEWHGRIFVPDLNQTARAKLRLMGPNEIRVTGCRMGGLVCKTQIWRRLEDPGTSTAVE